MRPSTQVRKRTLCIGSDRTVFQLTDKLCFILFTSIAEHLHGIRLGNVLTFDLFFLGYQLKHLSLDSSEITLFDHGLARIHVIIETVLDRRTDTEFNTRI